MSNMQTTFKDNVGCQVILVLSIFGLDEQMKRTEVHERNGKNISTIRMQMSKWDQMCRRHILDTSVANLPNSNLIR